MRAVIIKESDLDRLIDATLYKIRANLTRALRDSSAPTPTDSAERLITYELEILRSAIKEEQ
jgi:hypothetical protein